MKRDARVNSNYREPIYTYIRDLPTYVLVYGCMRMCPVNVR